MNVTELLSQTNRNFTESIDINIVLSFGKKDLKGNKKKNKAFMLINFPCIVKAKTAFLIICDELEVQDEFGDLCILANQINQITKNSLKHLNAVLSISSSMSKFATKHKLLGTKGLSPKENEGTLFKKKEDLIVVAKNFNKKLCQRVCFNMLEKTCILNCSIGNMNSTEEEINKNISRLKDFILGNEIKEMFELPITKTIKILSNNITSTMEKKDHEKTTK